MADIASRSIDQLREAEDDAVETERQVQALRTSLVNGTPLIATDVEIAIPKPGASPRTIAKLPRKGWKMGDAEAELVLAAGKRLSHVRRIQRVSLDQAIEDQAEEIVARARQGLPWHADSDDEDELEEFDLDAQTPRAKMGLANGVATSSGGTAVLKGTPPSPYKASPQRGSYPHVAHPTPGLLATPRRLYGSDSVEPSPGGFDHLLQAAHALGDDNPSPSSGRPAGAPLSAYSARSRSADPTKRRRSSTAEWPLALSSASRQLNSLQDHDTDSDAHPSSDSYSALDVLAEASASQDLPADVFGPRKRVRTHSAGGGAVVPAAGASTGFAPPGVQSLPVYQGPRPNGLAGPAMILVPPKPERAPYIKWNVEEDEELVKAVLQHGLRWDQVATAVTTRSYHQVRQRFLRGLKCEFILSAGSSIQEEVMLTRVVLVAAAGEALPSELMHYQPELLKAVREYEAVR